MSWATVFPILTDEHVEAYETGVSKKDRKLYDEYFKVKKIVNPRDVRHIISTSLFWKNIRMSEPDIVIKNRASLMNAGKRKTLLRFDPWKHYVQPLLTGARKLQQRRPDAAFCVHLAADLEFLIPDLVEVGCEVRLMKTSSIRHNPGAMWRFLPLEETGRLVTVLDADSAGNPDPHLDRTVEVARMSLGWWRVPVWGELNEMGNLNYRPFVACHFGTVKQISAKQLMQALLWHSQNGTIETRAQLPGCREAPVHGTVWPDYGFDEWWLTAALYPRAAMDGLLTFVPASAKSRLLPLDIEYASWAHPDSELVYFGSAGGGCCGPVVERARESDLEQPAENAKIEPIHTALKCIDQTKLIPLRGFTEHHPLPPQAMRDKVLGKAAVDPEVQAWFNPAGLVWRGKRWIAYRTECVPIWKWGRISLAQVSEKFECIPKTNRLLSLPTGFGDWCAEDPRLFTYQNRMFLYYTDHYYAGLAEISPSGRVIQAKLFPSEQRGALPHPDKHDKNWGFFESEGRLYAVFWTQPHIVREVNLKTWKFGKEWKTEWKCPVPGGELHGGSSPVFHDGLFWRVVHYHQAPPTNEWGRKYFLWLMAFEPVPPFAPVWFSKRPLLTGEGSSEIASLQGRDWQVVFCASMERLAKGWRLLLGHNDRRMCVAEISDRELRPHLVKIGRKSE